MSCHCVITKFLFLYLLRMPAASIMTGGRALLLCTNTENCIYQSVNGYENNTIHIRIFFVSKLFLTVFTPFSSNLVMCQFSLQDTYHMIATKKQEGWHGYMLALRNVCNHQSCWILSEHTVRKVLSVLFQCHSDREDRNTQWERLSNRSQFFFRGLSTTDLYVTLTGFKSNSLVVQRQDQVLSMPHPGFDFQAQSKNPSTEELAFSLLVPSKDKSRGLRQEGLKPVQNLTCGPRDQHWQPRTESSQKNNSQDLNKNKTNF